MTDNWNFNVQHVNPGEPVDAGVVGRPDRALADRTAYLKDRLDAAAGGKALFDLSAPVDGAVLEGHAVYWDAEQGMYKKAQAVVTTDDASGALIAEPSCHCVGLCYKKINAAVADIVLYGLVTFSDFSNAVGVNAPAGKYYLSGAVAGKITTQKPAISSAVCYLLGPRDTCTTDVRVLVQPNMRDSLDEHNHFKKQLYPFAAGNVVVTGDTVSIAAGDENQRGWLPADHAVFGSGAPDGAKFGYNLAADPALKNVWPPIPLQSVSVLWDKGQNRLGATEVAQYPEGVVRVDANGIWWFTDCREDVPFMEGPAEEDLDLESCPRSELFRVWVVYTRLLLGTDRFAVTSLEPLPGSPIEVTNCNHENATTGDLHIDIDFAREEIEPLTDAAHQLGAIQGGKVVVGATPANEVHENKNTLKIGWVTEGLIVRGSTQLTANSSWERLLTDDEKVYFEYVDDNAEPLPDEIKLHQGIVRLNYDDEFSIRELSPQIVRLDDAVERIYEDIPYLGFPAGQESSIRIRFNVPALSTLATDLSLQLHALVFNTNGGAIGSLAFSTRKIAHPSFAGENVTETLIPPSSGETTLSHSGATTATKNYVVPWTVAAVDAAPGDTVYFTVARPSADATPGDVGIIRLYATLTKKS